MKGSKIQLLMAQHLPIWLDGWMQKTLDVACRQKSGRASHYCPTIQRTVIVRYSLPGMEPVACLSDRGYLRICQFCNALRILPPSCLFPLVGESMSGRPLIGSGTHCSRVHRSWMNRNRVRVYGILQLVGRCSA